MLRTSFIIIMALLAIPNHLHAKKADTINPDGLSFRQNIEAGFKAIYDYDFPKAFAIVQGLKTTDKDNPQTYLLLANYWWWKIISGEETEENYKEMEAALHTALKKLPKKNTEEYTHEELYNAINIYSYKSRIKIYQKQYIKGAQNLNTCIDFIEASFGNEQQYELFKLTSGLYYYFVEYGYDNYAIARPYLAFLPDGDKQKGLGFLINAAQSPDFLVKTEASYFLMKTYCELELNPSEAKKYSSALISLHPNNLLYRYLHCKILLQLNEKEQALEQITKLQIALQNEKPHAQHFVSLAQEDLKQFYVKEE